MLMRVAVLNSNVSGAASTTGSYLDTKCCVYIDCQLSCCHSGTNTVAKQRRNLDILWRDIPTPDHANSATTTIPDTNS